MRGEVTRGEEATRPLRVCCVAYHAYPAIEPRAAGDFGGTETRAWQFARGLARRGDCEVSLVVRRPERLRQREREGVRLIRRPGRLARMWGDVAADVQRRPTFPWLRVRRARPALLWELPLIGSLWLLRRRPVPPLPADRFFSRIETDVLCAFGVHIDSARVIATAVATGRASVLMLGSDADLDPRFRLGASFTNLYGDRGDVCGRLLADAGAVVAQTDQQRDALREHFDRDATVIPNPIDLPAWDAAADTPPPELAGLDRYALWIGRADETYKRPSLCLEVARRCPDIPFVMILNPYDEEADRRTRDATPPNVRIVDRLPFGQMPAALARAAVLVNTSSLEGFPNTFLQAGASRVPVASLAVMPEWIAASGGGYHAGGDVDALAGYVRRVWSDEGECRTTGSRGRRYVETHHGLDAAAARLHEVLTAAARSVSG